MPVTLRSQRVNGPSKNGQSEVQNERESKTMEIIRRG